MRPCDTNGMSMDHRQAQSTKAAERYFLGDMSELEKFAFEAHYFECEECENDVRTLNALAQGIKLVSSEEPATGGLEERASAEVPPRRASWLAWLSPQAFAPAAVAAGLAVVVAYQGLVLIPGLRWAASPQAMAPVVLRAAARGPEQPVDVRRDQPVTFLSLDVNNAEPGTPMTYEVGFDGGGSRMSSSTTAPPAGAVLVVMLPTATINQPGQWTLTLHNQKTNEVSKYPFSVQLK
ncbi:MAG TPA: zf-HC2 domain-containing protein [Candidatus Solibacter sp.]|nr:zf-HC2 domain-containing protein [Candidatus Solibacter sp.]